MLLAYPGTEMMRLARVSSPVIPHHSTVDKSYEIVQFGWAASGGQNFGETLNFRKRWKKFASHTGENDGAYRDNKKSDVGKR